MRNIRASLAAIGIASIVASTGAGAQFTNAFVFGDSLSDAGQYGSRFTTNPGLTFPMYLSERYGFSVGPSFQGGNDYGQGGARVNSPSPLIPPNAPNLSIADQVTQFLAKGPVDRNALFQLQGGANDLFVLASQAAAGQITAAQLQAGAAARSDRQSHLVVRRRHPSLDGTGADLCAGGGVDDRRSGEDVGARGSAARRRGGEFSRHRR